MPSNLHIFLIYMFVRIIFEVESIQFATYRCTDGRYFQSNYFCNGGRNCVDAVDEGYGCNRSKCGSGMFTCADGSCVSIDVHCDGISNCVNGSDELHCERLLQLSDCTLAKNRFLCKDGIRCIEMDRTCNGEYNCQDGSDENTIGCNEKFAVMKSPNGPYYAYNYTKNTMNWAPTDITSCNVLNTNCDQKCIIYKNLRYCDCEENFFFDSSKSKCVENDANKNMFIYTTSEGIKAIPGYKNYSVTIMNSTEHTNITAISAANEYVYWAGIRNGVPIIGKTPLRGGEQQLVISNNITEINAIDVDWRTGNIYFIENKRKRLVACTENQLCIDIHKLKQIATAFSLAPRFGYNFRFLYSLQKLNPVLQPKSYVSYMFWSTSEEDGGYIIKRSDMNGNNRYSVVSNSVGNAVSISVDEIIEKVYWCDGINNFIEEVHFSGKRRQIVDLNLKNPHYLAVAVNAGVLHWILKNSSVIQYYSKHSIGLHNAVIDHVPINLIYAYSYSEKTIKMPVPCNDGCDGICLPTSSRYGTGSFCGNANTNMVYEPNSFNEIHQKNVSNVCSNNLVNKQDISNAFNVERKAEISNISHMEDEQDFENPINVTEKPNISNTSDGVMKLDCDNINYTLPRLILFLQLIFLVLVAIIGVIVYDMRRSLTSRNLPTLVLRDFE